MVMFVVIVARVSCMVLYGIVLYGIVNHGKRLGLLDTDSLIIWLITSHHASRTWQEQHHPWWQFPGMFFHWQLHSRRIQSEEAFQFEKMLSRRKNRQSLLHIYTYIYVAGDFGKKKRKEYGVFVSL